MRMTSHNMKVITAHAHITMFHGCDRFPNFNNHELLRLISRFARQSDASFCQSLSCYAKMRRTNLILLIFKVELNCIIIKYFQIYIYYNLERFKLILRSN